MIKLNLKSENAVALLNISATFIVAGINFITVPIFTRLLDTEAYGIVSLYTAWVQIFTVFVGLKCDGSIASAKANLCENEQDSYQFSILLLAIISFGLVFALMLLLMTPLSSIVGLSDIMCVFMLLQSFGAFVISFFNMRFIFRKEAFQNFILSVLVCIATTLLSVVLVVAAPFEGYVGRAIGLMLPNLIIGLCLLVSFARKKPRFNIRYWGFCLPLSLPLVFHGLSQLVLSQVNKVSLQYYCDYSAVGVFSLCVTVAGLVGVVYNALNNAYVPFLYEDFAETSVNSKKQEHFSNYFILFTLGTIAFCFLAPEVFKIMSTPAYYSGIDYLPLLLIGQYCVFLYSFPVNYEFFLKKTASIAIGTAGAAIENALLSIWLIPILSTTGAAIASMLSYFSLFLFHFLIARMLYKDRNFSPVYFFGGLLLVAVFAVCSSVCADFVVLRWIVGLLFLGVALGRCVMKKRVF